MGATYTRQSTYADGDTISAADTNDEFDQLLAAFASSSGHTHDGTAGEGGPISSLLSNSITFGTGADTDIAITFDGNTSDGVLTWMEDEDYFQFSDDILISTTEKIQFRDTAIYINSSADGQLDIVADAEAQIVSPIVDINASTGIALDGANLNSDWTVNTTNKILFRDSGLYINSSTDGQLDIAADTELEITAPLVEISADATVGDDLTLKSDAAVLGFGADTDVTMTHVADTGVLLNAASVIQFRDSAINIGSPADGDLDINADDEIELNSTLIDINGNVDVSGTSTLTGNVTLGGQLIMPDVTAGHILVADGTSYEEKAVGDLAQITTVANDDVFLAVDTSGGGLKKITRSAVVAGLATSGAISNVSDDTTPQLGGNLDMNGADIVTTSNATIDLAPNGTGTVVVRGNTNSGAIVFNCESNTHGQTVIAQPHSASVTNTMLLPAGASSTLVSLVSTDTLTNKTLTSPIINTGTFGTSILPVSADGTTLGSASKEFSDLFLADAGTVQFGNDQDVTLTHVADTGLLLNAASVVQFRDSAINIGSPADGDLDINADDEIELNSTLIDVNGNLDVSGTIVGASTLSATTGTFSGVLKTDDTTNATSTTDGSLQTDGGLSVVLDAVFGDDVKLLTDSAVLSLGVDSDATFTHDGTTGLTIAATPISIDSTGELHLNSTTGDIKLQDGGTDQIIIDLDGTAGAVIIKPAVDSDDIVFQQYDGTAVMTVEDNVSLNINNDITVAGRASGHVTTDNDGSFDLAVGNDFKCTTAGGLTLTFTNPAAGQSGNVMFINGSNHAIAAHASVAINADVLTAISATGTYHLAYYCSAASGNNTILVSASAILT
tara:strand:+ start:3537 stop:6065 length:2529 start_codon:yes stop_codon:yes gene_type:complete